MSGFRPRLVPTGFTFAVVLACAALGVWQLHRLDWKRALIAQREAALTASPVAPPHTLADARPLEFHPVVAEGVFQHDREIFLGAIGPHGAAGFDVLTPLRETDASSVFVNRGFVPTELKDPARRAASQPAGPVRVAGLLRVPPDAKPGWFVPDNRPDLNYWFWVDLPAISAAAGLVDAAGRSAAAPFYIDADATPNPGGWPRGGHPARLAQRSPAIRDHLVCARGCGARDLSHVATALRGCCREALPKAKTASPAEARWRRSGSPSLTTRRFTGPDQPGICRFDRCVARARQSCRPGV
jgi:surfeit locus 1 family protein